MLHNFFDKKCIQLYAHQLVFYCYCFLYGYVVSMVSFPLGLEPTLFSKSSLPPNFCLRLIFLLKSPWALSSYCPAIIIQMRDDLTWYTHLSRLQLLLCAHSNKLNEQQWVVGWILSRLFNLTGCTLFGEVCWGCMQSGGNTCTHHSGLKKVLRIYIIR